MECLRGRIGILGYGAAPESGKYINQLPGISLEYIDKLSKTEQATFVKVWNDVQTRGLAKFENNIISAFAKRYRKKTLRQSINLGKIISLTEDQSTATDQYRGFVAETNYPNVEPYTVSTLLGISFQSLSLYLKAVPASEFQVKIWDMDTGDVLWSKTLNNAANPVAVGWNDITVESVFYSSFRVFAGFEATEIDSPLLKLNSAYLGSIYGGCLSAMAGCSCEGRIQGAETTTKSDPTTHTISDNSFGLTGVFSVVCSFYPLVCNNKQLFDNALLYQLGEELVTECMFSERWNFFTIAEDRAQEMIFEFKGVRGREIEKSIDGIDLDLRDACIECNEKITVKNYSL